MLSFNKLIVPLLPSILKALSGGEQVGNMISQVKLLNLISNEVKKQMSKLILKISFALAATGVLTYSLIILAQHANAFMQTYQNGVVFSVIFFMALTGLCVLGLFLVFREEPPVQMSSFQSLGAGSFSFEKIYMNFLEGLARGIEQNQAAHDAEKHSGVKVEDEFSTPESSIKQDEYASLERDYMKSFSESRRPDGRHEMN